MASMRISRVRPAFTLVELLVVIAIIGILVALLLPAVQAAREAARRSQCSNNLKQMGLAVQNFHDVRRFLPASRIRDHWAPWAVQILPQMEQQPLYDQWDLSMQYYQQSNTARLTNVNSYYCPSRRKPPLSSTKNDIPDNGNPNSNHTSGALSDYAVTVGDDGPNNAWNTVAANGAIIYGTSTVSGAAVTRWNGTTAFQDLTDGLSSTMIIGEKHVRLNSFADANQGDGSIYNGDHPGNFSRIAGPGYALARSPLDTYRTNFGSYHPGICQFAFADGSVHSLAVQINTTTLGYLVVRNDGQAIDHY